MKAYKILLIILLINTYVHAQNTKFGTRSTSLSGASVSLVDIWASYNNQAALAKLKNIEAACFYSKQFNIKELANKAITCNLPSKYGNFNINIAQFGFSTYKETKIGLAYSRQLFKNLFLGIQFDRLSIKQTSKNSNDLYAYTFELGILSNISQNLQIGFHIFNPTQTKLKSERYTQNIETRAKLGASWRIDNHFMLTSQYKLMFNKKTKIALGVEYYMNEKIIFRCGISNKPKSISIGLAYKYKKISCGLAFWRHQTLGYSPSADIIFSF